MHALGNAWSGVLTFGSATETIGGTTAAARNVISGNGLTGVYLYQPGSTGNSVDGNLIGVAADGTTPLGNTTDGVLVNGAATNTIGGKGAAGNVISGNGGNGVYLLAAGATKNKVLGNLIGTQSGGTAALANALDGVFISGAPTNTIGGKSTLRNVVSGNTGNGVEINGTAAKSNKVLGNDIGTAKNGSDALPNGGYGILLTNSASSNKIGGTATSLPSTAALGSS